MYHATVRHRAFIPDALHHDLRDREISFLFALENPADIDASLSSSIGNTGAIASSVRQPRNILVDCKGAPSKNTAAAIPWWWMQSTSSLSSDLSRLRNGKNIGKNTKIAAGRRERCRKPLCPQVFFTILGSKNNWEKNRGKWEAGKRNGKILKSSIRDSVSWAVF
jgi:hypothetical protein